MFYYLPITCPLAEIQGLVQNDSLSGKILRVGWLITAADSNYIYALLLIYYTGVTVVFVNVTDRWR